MMKILSAKSNSANTKRQLEKDARLLYRSADSVYRHELAKPRCERDADLMEECLRVMKDSSAVLAGGKNRTTTSMYALRWAAVACLCIFLLAAVATGVSYAAGVDLFSLIFSRSDNGITIQGHTGDITDSDDDSFVFSEIPSTDGTEYTSFDAAITDLGINPLNLDLTNLGLMVDNIYVIKNDVVLEVSSAYENGDDFALYTVQVYDAGASTAFVTDILGSYDETETVSVDGINVYTASGDDGNVLCWTDDVYVYTVHSNLNSEVLISLISKAMD